MLRIHKPKNCVPGIDHLSHMFTRQSVLRKIIRLDYYYMVHIDEVIVTHIEVHFLIRQIHIFLENMKNVEYNVEFQHFLR